jgi:hypothetical protein
MASHPDISDTACAFPGLAGQPAGISGESEGGISYGSESGMSGMVDNGISEGSDIVSADNGPSSKAEGCRLGLGPNEGLDWPGNGWDLCRDLDIDSD